MGHTVTAEIAEGTEVSHGRGIRFFGGSVRESYGAGALPGRCVVVEYAAVTTEAITISFFGSGSVIHRTQGDHGER